MESFATLAHDYPLFEKKCDGTPYRSFSGCVVIEQMLHVGCGQFTVGGPIIFCIIELVGITACYASASVCVHADGGDFMWEVVEFCEGQPLVGGEVETVPCNPDLTGRGAISTFDYLLVGGKGSRFPRLAPIVRIPVGVTDLFVFEGIVYLAED